MVDAQMFIQCNKCFNSFCFVCIESLFHKYSNVDGPGEGKPRNLFQRDTVYKAFFLMFVSIDINHQPCILEICNQLYIIIIGFFFRFTHTIVPKLHIFWFCLHGRKDFFKVYFLKTYYLWRPLLSISFIF